MDLAAIALEPADIAIALIATDFAAFAAFAAFGLDKMLAEQKQRRISEATLLHLAFSGGIAGCLCPARAVPAQDEEAAF